MNKLIGVFLKELNLSMLKKLIERAKLPMHASFNEEKGILTISESFCENAGMVFTLECELERARHIAKSLGFDMDGSSPWCRYVPHVTFVHNRSKAADEIYLELMRSGIPYGLTYTETNRHWEYSEGQGTMMGDMWSAKQIIKEIHDLQKQYKKVLAIAA
jgi:hypothetical protein